MSKVAKRGDRTIEAIDGQLASQAGMARGRREIDIDRRNCEITIAALRKGLDISLIMKLTGLSLEEIEKLRENLGD